MRNHLMTLSLVLAAPLLAVAAVAANGGGLRHFTPGNYVLVKGDMDDCGYGEFKQDSETHVTLGFLHGSDLDSKSGSLAADAPEEKGCTYDFQDNPPTVSADETVAGFTEIMKCNGKLKHTMNQTVHFKDDEVHLTINQTGDEAYQYSCTWKLKTDKAD